MQTRNPVLSRIGQESPASGGSGFAYDEGVSAMNAARTGTATTTATGAATGYRPPTAPLVRAPG